VSYKTRRARTHSRLPTAFSAQILLLVSSDTIFDVFTMDRHRRANAPTGLAAPGLWQNPRYLKQQDEEMLKDASKSKERQDSPHKSDSNGKGKGEVPSAEAEPHLSCEKRPSLDITDLFKRFLESTRDHSSKVESAQRDVSLHTPEHVAAKPSQPPTSRAPRDVSTSQNPRPVSQVSDVGQRGRRAGSPQSFRTAFDFPSRSRSASVDTEPSTTSSLETVIPAYRFVGIPQATKNASRRPSVRPVERMQDSEPFPAHNEAEFTFTPPPPAVGNLGRETRTPKIPAPFMLSSASSRAPQALANETEPFPTFRAPMANAGPARRPAQPAASNNNDDEIRPIANIPIPQPQFPTALPPRFPEFGRDAERALPPAGQDQEKPSKSKKRTCWRLSPWVIAWVILSSALVVLLGREYKTELENARDIEATSTSAAAAVEARAVVQPDWRIFNYTQEYLYIHSWSPGLPGQCGPPDTNATTSENTTTTDPLAQNATLKMVRLLAKPIPATDFLKLEANTPENNTWGVSLDALTRPNGTALNVDLRITANHSVDLTALCPSSPACPSPIPLKPSSSGTANPSSSDPSPATSSPACSLSSARSREPLYTQFLRIMLDCTIFVPIWLLCQYGARLVSAKSLAGLGLADTVMMIKVLGIVVAILGTGGLALGVELAVLRIVENMYAARSL
jgi:hypothetical protein